MRDLSVSAFTGANLDPEKGDLGRFVLLASQKNSPIPKGSILAIENLDRFSRLPPHKAYRVFCELVEAGITILTLDPLEQFDSSNIADMGATLSCIIKMQLNYEKSKRQSAMIGKHWIHKREQAQEGKPISSVCPSWLQWDGKHFKVKPLGRKVLQFIFDRTAEGQGQKQITYALNEKFKTIGRGKVYHPSFVGWIVPNRQVLGEYQPCTHNEQGERIPDGKAIVGYYPRVIPDDLFYRANAVRTAHKKQSGRTADFVNLFVGLVACTDGYPMQIKSDRAQRKRSEPYVRRAFQSLGHRVGKADACPFSVPYDDVENLILVALQEIKPSEFKGKSNGQSKVVMELAGVQARLDELVAMMGNTTMRLPTEVGKVVEELNGRRQRLQADIERHKQDEATRQSKPLEQFHTIFDALKEATGGDKHSLRLKMRTLIASLVERIELEPLSQTDGRHKRIGCNVVIRLRGGGVRTAYRHYGTESPMGWSWLDRPTTKKSKGKIVGTAHPA
jgi:hypothetical protein